MSERLSDPCLSDDNVELKGGMKIYAPSTSSAVSVPTFIIADAWVEYWAFLDPAERNQRCILTACGKSGRIGECGFIRRGVFTTKNAALQKRIDDIRDEIKRKEEKIAILESRKD